LELTAEIMMDIRAFAGNAMQKAKNNDVYTIL
jgi:hypothetical protein